MEVFQGHKGGQRHLNIKILEKFQWILISYNKCTLENIRTEILDVGYIGFPLTWNIQDLLRDKGGQRHLDIKILEKFQWILISYDKYTLENIRTEIFRLKYV